MNFTLNVDSFQNYLRINEGKAQIQVRHTAVRVLGSNMTTFKVI